ncbi:MAG: CerR family C-terminal domain-containing protein [bacterium]|nr:CerR family C-terminal domain-containing protein [bacterium]
MNARNASPTRQTGYAKGDETRRTILAAALAEFGDHGFNAATTRGIAGRAGVPLPSLSYYFGNKEGVYRACAQEIVDRYTEAMATPAGIALSELGTASPDACATRLRQVVRRLAEFVVGSDDSRVWSGFVTREMQEQGPAFEILYRRLWAPGLQLLSRLIAGANGANEIRDQDRLDALMLVSSLVAFQSGRAVSLRIMAWRKLDAAALDQLFAAIDRLMDGIVRKRG